MRPPHSLIIAIDGPAGAGKSTAARCAAQRLGYRYLDTGAMYRTVALKALREGMDLADQEALGRAAEDAKIDLRTEADTTRVWLDGVEVTSEIRNPAVTEAASRVSVVPRVRQAMVRQQRRWGEQGGVVMEGRDIGTVVFPEADVKIFLDASPAERARRRAAELALQGIPLSTERVRQELAARDARDAARPASPLVRAPDAVLVETDGLSPDAVVELILQICRRKGAEA
jgi:cytidylate kinase